MDILSGELTPTKTYAARSWVWVGGLAPDRCDGVLTVSFAKGKTGRAAVESRRYLVQRQPDDGPVRRWFFLKVEPVTPDEPAPVYEVTAMPGGVWDCTCTADQCKAPCCVHKDVVPALIAAGVYDGDPEDPAPSEASGLWHPDEPPADDESLPECFQGVGGSADRAPF